MKIKNMIKKKNSIYRVFFDNGEERDLYEDVIVNLNLLLKEIDDDYLKVILEENEIAEIKYQVIKFIEKKIRSKNEIVNFLYKKTDKEIIIGKIIKYLEAVKLINDKNFAKAYVNDKFEINKWGINKVKKGLIEHKINNFLIEESLEVITDEIQIRRIKNIIDNYLKRKKTTSTYKLKTNLQNLLINKGYPINLINDQITKVEIDDFDNLKKDYEKLSKIYSKEKVIKKLLTKGYKYQDIKKLES